MLRSKTYAENMEVGGVILGQPIIGHADGSPFQPGDDLSDLFFLWDDHRIGSGEIIDGKVVPDGGE